MQANTRADERRYWSTPRRKHPGQRPANDRTGWRPYPVLPVDERELLDFAALVAS